MSSREANRRLLRTQRNSDHRASCRFSLFVTSVLKEVAAKLLSCDIVAADELDELCFTQRAQGQILVRIDLPELGGIQGPAGNEVVMVVSPPWKASQRGRSGNTHPRAGLSTHAEEQP